MKHETNYHAAIKKWKEKKITDIATLDIKLNNFYIPFAYHSGVIENNEITYQATREIFENHKIINFTDDIHTIQEIKNQKNCFEWLKSKMIEKIQITPKFIKQIHFLLTIETYDERRYLQGECPGEYKKHDYNVGSGHSALPEEVPGEIEELCEELQNISDNKDHVIIAAAYLHCKFENIHPFADGNGRVGRTLMNYFLIIHDYPPLIIRNETKYTYYKALERYDKTGELIPFINYMKHEMAETWKTPDHHSKT